MEKTQTTEGNGAILLFLSLCNPKSSIAEYKVRNSNIPLSYIGTYTNEAPVSYLLDMAHRNGRDIKSIICILSFDCFKNPISSTNENNGKTSWDIFNNFVKDYCSKNNINVPALIPISYDYDSSTKELIPTKDPAGNGVDPYSLRSLNIYQSVYEKMQENNISRFYIDFTGGTRDTSYLFTMIIQNLQSSGAKCSSIIYSNYQTHEIISLDQTYNMAKIMDAQNTFADTGNAEKLYQVFKEMIKENDSEEYRIVNYLICALKELTDTISLCNVTDLDAVIQKLDQTVKEADNIKFGSDNMSTDSLFLELFRSVTTIIKQSVFSEDYSHGFSYKNIIKWCLSKRMIQQALTIYTEKMPIYYYNAGLLDDFGTFNKDIPIQNNFTSIEAQIFYLEFFNQCVPEQFALTNNVTTTIISKWNESPISPTKLLDFVAWLNEQENIASSPQEQTCYKELSKLITNTYDINQYTKSKGANIINCLPQDLAYGSINTDKMSIGTLLSTSGIGFNDQAMIHCFMYNDLKAFELHNGSIESNQSISKDEKDKIKKSDNTIKKLQKCLYMEHGLIDQSMKNKLSKYPEEEQKRICRRMADIMRYYNLIKYIRNHTNHAAENSNDPVEKAYKDFYGKGIYLNNTNIKSSLPTRDISCLNADNVVDIINYGINLF